MTIQSLFGPEDVTTKSRSIQMKTTGAVYEINGYPGDTVPNTCQQVTDYITITDISEFCYAFR